MAITTDHDVDVRLGRHGITAAEENEWRNFVAQSGTLGSHCGPEWLKALGQGLRHPIYWLHARRGNRMVGVVPLAFVKSMAFGRFLVGLPYVNWAGVLAQDDAVAAALIDRAVQLADELDVRYLELRHSENHKHPSLSCCLTSKVQMRLHLSPSEEEVWKTLRSVVRTQVRKGQKQGILVEWGRQEVLDDFYRVFAVNMRDLGTPVLGRVFFERILAELPHESEFCVVRKNGQAIAGALAIHGPGLTEVPSASVLRSFRSTAANSLMYWRLIQRSIQRGQQIFDFGRSTVDSSTYAFKAKWGARPEPAIWQYYVRKGNPKDLRPESGKYHRMITLWKHLPVRLTRIIGPPIVRGIP